MDVHLRLESAFTMPRNTQITGFMHYPLSQFYCRPLLCAVFLGLRIAIVYLWLRSLWLRSLRLSSLRLRSLRLRSLRLRSLRLRSLWLRSLWPSSLRLRSLWLSSLRFGSL